MKDLKVGFAFCGSFCTFHRVMAVLEETAARFSVYPIVSENSAAMDTRFGNAHDFMREMQRICDRRVAATISEVEPIGPQKLLDVLVIAPCTGNTLGKLAAGIADTSVTMAAKAHLRNGRPVVIALSTNDGLGASARSIGELMARKNIYFVPFRQDDPEGKPTSLVAEMEMIPMAIECAMEGRQMQPLILGPESCP